MRMILSGSFILANEALTMGLVSQLFPPSLVVTEAIELANSMSKYSMDALIAAKQSINNSFEMVLDQGISKEQLLFKSLLSTVMSCLFFDFNFSAT